MNYNNYSPQSETTSCRIEPQLWRIRLHVRDTPDLRNAENQRCGCSSQDGANNQPANLLAPQLAADYRHAIKAQANLA